MRSFASHVGDDDGKARLLGPDGLGGLTRRCHSRPTTAHVFLQAFRPLELNGRPSIRPEPLEKRKIRLRRCSGYRGAASSSNTWGGNGAGRSSRRVQARGSSVMCQKRRGICLQYRSLEDLVQIKNPAAGPPAVPVRFRKMAVRYGDDYLRLK